MINSDNLCMSCMKEIGNLKQCPHCGFHVDSPQIAPYLPIRTVLGNRYIVGKLLDYNGDGATYMGLDLTTRTAVNIREFFPEGLVTRDPKTFSIIPPEEHFILFNECLHSFVEMWRKLMRLSGLSALIKVHDVLEGNGTCYAITENIDGVTLREYLLRNSGGYITWDRARPLLMPVLSTLGTLHSSGIVHRAISPSTLVVAPDGKIRITGFSISQVRSAKSELKSQLYTGYAAFEQYGFDGRQGTWTDIYGFGAVLYRTLIGTDPIDATERVTNDRLMVPGKFAEQLPAYVINGLVNALQILPEDRTHSVEELRAELSASPTAVANSSNEFKPPVRQPKYQLTAQRIENEPEDYTADKREAAQKRHNTSSIIVAISSIIIVLTVVFVVLWQLDIIKLEDQETTTVSEVEKIPVPNFVGKQYNDIITNPYFTKNFKFEKIETYSNEDNAGEILEQSHHVNSEVPVNTVIKLKVSVGKKEIKIPTDISIGQNADEVKERLEKLGFVVEKLSIENSGDQVANTIVSFLNFTPGEELPYGTKLSIKVWGEPQTEAPTEIPTEEPSSDSTDNNRGQWPYWGQTPSTDPSTDPFDETPTDPTD